MKKLFVLAFCVIFIIGTVFVGCSNDNNNENNNNQNVTDNNNQNNNEDNNDDNNANNDDNVNNDDTANNDNNANDNNDNDGLTGADKERGYKLPLTEEPVTFRIVCPDNYYAPASYTQGLPVFQEIEEKTNVIIDWEPEPPGQYAEAVKVKIAAAENLPDLFLDPGIGINKLVKDELIIELSSLIEENAPNLTKIFNERPDYLGLVQDYSGNIYQFPLITEAKGFMSNFMMRGDWLEKLNLEEPNTTEDYLEVWTAFKEDDPNGNGEQDEIPFFSYARDNYRSLGYSFGLHLVYGQAWHPNDQGIVEYEYIVDEYKLYLEYLKEMYDRGLLRKDFVTDDGNGLGEYNSKALVGSFVGWNSGIDIQSERAQQTDPDAMYITTPPPKGPDGDQYMEIWWPLQKNSSISADCENPELLTRWIDYVAYSEEGQLYTIYGVEGLTYEMVDGEPVYTDMVLDPEEGLSFHNVLRSVGAMPNIPYMTAQDEQNAVTQSEYSKEQNAKVQKYSIPCLPYGILPWPGDDTMRHSELDSMMNDITTYVQEMEIKFINGSEPLSNFDEYVDMVKELGIEEIIFEKQKIHEWYTELED